MSRGRTWRAACGCWRRRRLLSWRFLSSGRVRRAASVPLLGPLAQELRQRPEIAEFVVRLGDVGGQRLAPAVDPGGRDAERLGADYVGAPGPGRGGPPRRVPLPSVPA